MMSSHLQVTVEKHHNTFPGDNTSMSSVFAASSLCQGMNSCLEPMCMRAPTKWDLSPLVPSKQAEVTHGECSIYGPIAGTSATAFRNGEDSTCRWASIDTLMSRANLAGGEGDQIYVHPLVRRAVSSLSMRSLEMCTESLGSETGSSIIELDVDESSSHQERLGRAATTPKARVSCRKDKQGSSFPPPLTSISGNDGLKIQTLREGGRLVIKAVTVPRISPCFQAERENGRLMLHLVKERCANDPELVEKEVGKDTSGDEDNDPELVEKEVEKDTLGDEDNDPELVEKEVEKDTLGDEDRAENDGNEDEFDGGFWEGKIGCNVGNGEWSGSSRCNGDGSGSKRLPSLPFCVAIS